MRLTKHMLTEAAANPALGRADALRRPMVSMLENPDNPFDAHSMFWAPFVVVREGEVPAGN